MARSLTAKFISTQQKKLLELRKELLNNMRSKSNDDLHVANDEVIEDGDQAQTYLNQNLSFGLRERELKRLHEIEDALARIEHGIYGICEETDEVIEKKRLEKMPWTKLSIEAAEELEREQQRFTRIG
ncbi:MAG: TraR/DksA family transcriptional regulator [Bdellovibrionales bacterium]|jgi:DnaK suppressor protein|nr:TraR/DksA family transcriptional regulator [Bdellovibrionales bacterium]